MNNTLLNINELIHELPIHMVQPNVFCVDCLIAIPIPLMAYKLDKVWVCTSCAHYLHQTQLNSCSVCCPNMVLEVNSMEDQEIMICPDGTTVISDDVIADIPLMRKMEE